MLFTICHSYTVNSSYSFCVAVTEYVYSVSKSGSLGTLDSLHTYLYVSIPNVPWYIRVVHEYTSSHALSGFGYLFSSK